MKKSKYNKACDLLYSQQYKESIILFNELKGYNDSKEKIT